MMKMMMAFICYDAVDEFLRYPHRLALVYKTERLLWRHCQTKKLATYHDV